MPMIPHFDDAFTLQQLTAVAQRLPEPPTLLGRLGIFDEDGIATTTVAVEYGEGMLSLVDPTPRGGPGEVVAHDRRKIVTFNVPHFQRDDSVLADEVQSRRAFGSADQLETVMERVAKKIRRHKNDITFTREHQRIGAISGKLTDSQGNIYADIFQTFGVAEPAAISFGLSSATTDLRGKCTQVMDTFADALDMEVGNDTHPVIGICGAAFWDALITHEKVVETYLNWEAAANLRGDARKPFEFGGIRWVRYRTSAKARAAKGNQPLIPDNTARFVVKGLPDLYITRFAPADYNETVNTLGESIYAKMWLRQDGKGYELQIQSNPISLCTRPQALIRATA